MTNRLKTLVSAIRNSFATLFGSKNPSYGAPGSANGENINGNQNGDDSEYQSEYPAEYQVKSRSILSTLVTPKVIKSVFVLSVIGVATYTIYQHPPLSAVQRGEIGLRSNQLTGNVSAFREGSVIVIPGLHQMRKYSLQDQLYRPSKNRSSSEAPFQSVEGLSLGVDLAVRYAIDSSKLVNNPKGLPDDVGTQIVEPLVQGVMYKAFTKYTVKEIFSSKRSEIQQIIETELTPKLAAEGIVLRAVTIGKIDLPEDYKRGMERLLQEELETEKMRYTLELKEKQVKQSALESEAEKVRREKAAEAAANEQVIAARAQEEAMKHVLPFKQKQIEQRQLEAEAAKISMIKTSEGNAQARLIEAAGEADSRRKLADAEAYRQELVGKVSSAQLERDGALLSKHPLLIQKTMADKLSDKISVIIAPPPADGGFIGSALLGTGKNTKTSTTKETAQTENVEANEGSN